MTDNASPTATQPGADASRDAADAASTVSATVNPLLDRVVKGAHDVIDGLAAKVSAKVDGVGDGVSKAGDAKDQWIGAARDAIRERPFAAMGIALLVGAAYVGLRSSSRNR